MGLGPRRNIYHLTMLYYYTGKEHVGLAIVPQLMYFYPRIEEHGWELKGKK